MKRDELDSLTEKVIGIAFKIHRALGPGFSEEAQITQINAPRITQMKYG